MVDDRLGDARRLVGQGNHGDIGMLSLGQLPDPVTQVALLALAVAQHGARTMGQQGA